MSETPVGERLATIETKVDLLLTKRDDHETRIRKLERLAWIVAGIAGAAGGTLARVVFPHIGG